MDSTESMTARDYYDSWQPWEERQHTDAASGWSELPLGSDDRIRSRPVVDGNELTAILFQPHGWLKKEHPDWFGKLTDGVQVTQIYSYPQSATFRSNQPVVEVVRTRPVVTFRKPREVLLDSLRDFVIETIDPKSVELILRVEDGLAYGHYHMGDDNQARKVLRAMIADPHAYMSEVAQAARPIGMGGKGLAVQPIPDGAPIPKDDQGNAMVRFEVVDDLRQVRFVCQLSASGNKGFDEPAVPPSCTMFTGEIVPDPQNKGGLLVLADTFWAADWPPQPVPIPPTPPIPPKPVP